MTGFTVTAMGASAVLHKETQLNVRLKCLKTETAATRKIYKLYYGKIAQEEF